MQYAYAYPWYVMCGLMLATGLAIWLVARLGDLGLQKLLDVMSARRDRKAGKDPFDYGS